MDLLKTQVISIENRLDEIEPHVIIDPDEPFSPEQKDEIETVLARYVRYLEELGFEDLPGSDCQAIFHKKVSVTPIRLDLTHNHHLDMLRKWDL